MMKEKKLNFSAVKSFCDGIFSNSKNYFIILTFLVILFCFSIYNTNEYLKFKSMDNSLNEQVLENIDESYIGSVEDYFLKNDIYMFYSFDSLQHLKEVSGNLSQKNDTFPENTNNSDNDVLIPDLQIIALIVLGNKSIAKLSIDGVPEIKFYRAGDTFYSGKGKILKINSKGVTWIWKGKVKNTLLQ